MLSICIPTYNRAKLLVQTLDCLLAQTSCKPEIECVISDNASTDDTAEVVAGFAARYNNVRYFRNETNIGADRNAMHCLQLAGGEYVWFCSDDDIPLNGIVDKIVDILKTHKPKFAFLNHTGFIEGEDYLVAVERGKNLPDAIFEDGEEMMVCKIANHFSATIVRRTDALRKLPHILDCQAAGYGQGFARGVLVQEIMLDKTLPGPCAYIGMNGLAVNNPKTLSYDVLKVTFIDLILQWQRLRLDGKLSPGGEQKLANWLIRCCSRGIFAAKAKKGGLPVSRQGELVQLLWRYPSFYYLVLPVLLMPHFLLAALFFPTRFVFRQLLRNTWVKEWWVRFQFSVGSAAEKK